MTKNLLSDPPERQILGVGQIDDLGFALLALTRELWVVIDRQAMLEKLLEHRGITPAEIDAFQPDEAFAAELDGRRKALIDTVVGALTGRGGAA